MKLREWLDKEQLTIEAFAKMIGVSKGAVTKWISVPKDSDMSERSPTRSTMRKIIDVTKGQVQANDFL